MPTTAPRLGEGVMANAGTSVTVKTASTVWGMAQGAAAEQGDVGAQNNLGLLYLHGQGVPQDCVRAHLAASGHIGRLVA